MSTAPSTGADEARRRALDVLGTLVVDAKSGRMPLGDLKAALGELRDLDPEMQRRVARAMMESRRDPTALRAAVEAAPSGGVRQRASSPKMSSHPPTVVDGRGGVPWVGIFIAAVTAALTAALLAGVAPGQ